MPYTYTIYTKATLKDERAAQASAVEARTESFVKHEEA